mmetsp:Transcript_22729/g.49249  ORF Transcript_22729/g.49249 Transcript_22729/m.49249 type:complete len:308 (-) Transcript_22729:297-1220(-)
MLLPQSPSFVASANFATVSQVEFSPSILLRSATALLPASTSSSTFSASSSPRDSFKDCIIAPTHPRRIRIRLCDVDICSSACSFTSWFNSTRSNTSVAMRRMSSIGTSPLAQWTADSTTESRSAGKVTATRFRGKLSCVPLANLSTSTRIRDTILKIMALLRRFTFATFSCFLSRTNACLRSPDGFLTHSGRLTDPESESSLDVSTPLSSLWLARLGGEQTKEDGEHDGLWIGFLQPLCSLSLCIAFNLSRSLSIGSSVSPAEADTDGGECGIGGRATDGTRGEVTMQKPVISCVGDDGAFVLLLLW